MKKLIILFSIVLVIAISFIFLYQSADILNKKSNGFQRTFSEKSVRIDSRVSNEFRMQRIIGTHNSRIYFFSSGIDYLISTDLNLNDPQKIYLSKKYVPGTTFGLDSNVIYSYSINENAVFTFSYDGKLLKSIPIKEPFSRIIALATDVFVIRDFKNFMKGVSFVKIKVDSTQDKEIILNEIKIESNKNNPFSNDGLLMFDKDSGTIAYVNFYHNKFFVMDTLFSRAIKYNTIDTVTSTNVLTKSVKSDNKVGVTNYSPANVINKYGALKNGKIHILSNLASDNQSKEQFMSSTTVDVYQVRSGKYLYSYTLPNSNNNKVKELFLTDSAIISIYADSIIKYSMN